MAKFNMGDFAKTLGAVPELGTDGRKQIEYIDIDLLHEDPRNFYEVSGVDELASNIALFGLMDPLLVRSAEDGTVQIVSGHRRHAALRKLVEEGREDLRSVPCIRVAGADSPALQELRLIYANADTRKMTNADIAKQAERVEQLLYQLKEEGQEFPGRMRDHVAEACKVSKSKLSRLHAIEKSLTDVWRPRWNEGKLNESVAYAISQMPQKHQEMFFAAKSAQPRGLDYLYERSVKVHSEYLENLEGIDCPKCGGKCSSNQIAAKYSHIAKNSSYYGKCERICCEVCSDLGSCKAACPLLKDRIAEIKADKKAQKEQEKIAQAERDAPTIEELKSLWSRFGECRRAAGKTVKQFAEAIKYFYGTGDDARFEKCEKLTEKFTATTVTPFQYKVYLDSIRALKAAADLFGVSLDYLLCRTDDPNGGAGEDATAKWREGVPRSSGLYYVKLRMEDFVLREVLWYDNVLEQFSFRAGHDPVVDGEVIGWYPLPCGLRNGEVEDDV